MAGTLNRDVFLPGESRPDLIAQLPILIRILAQQERDPRHAARRRTAPCHNKTGRHNDQFRIIQALRLVVQDIAHKVFPILRTPGNPHIHLLARQLEVLLARLGCPLGHDPIHLRLQLELHQHLEPHQALRARAYHLQPRLIRIIQAPRRLSESQVADHIEGHQRVPLGHVLRLGAALAQLLDHLVRVALQEALLLADGALGEGGQDGAAQAAVAVLLLGHHALDAVDGRGRNAAAVEALAELGRLLAVDLLPGGAGGIGELVGRDADDWAVLFVELADAPAAAAFHVVVCVRLSSEYFHRIRSKEDADDTYSSMESVMLPIAWARDSCAEGGGKHSKWREEARMLKSVVC